MIGLFRASAIALALLWANWRNVDAIGEIFRHWRKTFMPVLVGLADELYVSCRTCSSRSFRILLMSFGREPAGNPLGTRWGPVGNPDRAEVLPLAGDCWRDARPAATW